MKTRKTIFKTFRGRKYSFEPFFNFFIVTDMKTNLKWPQKNPLCREAERNFFKAHEQHESITV